MSSRRYELAMGDSLVECGTAKDVTPAGCFL